MDNTPFPPPDFSGRYWRCLYEFKVRPFRFAERRLVEKILDLTYGRGQPDVAIANRDDLAESIGSTRNNLQPVVEKLISLDVLAHEERLGTWWLKEIDLWRVGCDDQVDPDHAARVAAAEARILTHDRLRLQPELIPRETTDAEVAAGGQQARAADWPATALPPAVQPPPPSGACSGEQADRSEIQDEPSEEARLKFRTAVLKSRRPVLNFRTNASSIDARAPACAGPGIQVNSEKNIPGNLGMATARPNRWQLDHAGWSLVREIEAWCQEGGDPPSTDKQRQHWEWRAWKNPLLLELCFRQTKAHVREGRKPAIRSRAGWIKHLWKQEERKAPAPDSAAEEAFARRCREEADRRFGIGEPLP